MIEVLRASPMMSIQDTGRHGLRHLGVPCTGMMDVPALIAANLLLGNARDAAGIEISFGPNWFKAHRDIQLVLMGADTRARLVSPDGKTSINAYLAPGFVHTIPAGHQLHCAAAGEPGQRSCIAVAGGIDVPLLLGSRSTDLVNQFGGHQGRPLHAGDRLPIAAATGFGATSPMDTRARGIRQPTPTPVLRAVAGGDHDAFTERARSALWHTEWQLTPLSNRTGLRLNGDRLQTTDKLEKNSSGVLPGVIQVPPDGQPIILASDAQTTGGYPHIASIIQADLWQLAYLAPGAVIEFSQVSIEEARALARAQSRKLDQLEFWLGRSRSTSAGSTGNATDGN